MRTWAVGFAGGALILQQSADVPSMLLVGLLAMVAIAALLLASRTGRQRAIRVAAALSADRLQQQALPLGTIHARPLVPGKVDVSCSYKTRRHATGWRYRIRHVRAIGVRLYGQIPLLLTLLGASIAGFDWAAWRAHERLRTGLPLALEGRDVRVVGRIEGLPVRGEGGMRFVLHVEQVLTPLPDGATAASFARRVQLSWSSGFRAAGSWGKSTPKVNSNSPPKGVPTLAAGQRWALTVRLKRPHANANFGGPDVEAGMLQRGVRATGYVRTSPAPERLTGWGDVRDRAVVVRSSSALVSSNDMPHEGAAVFACMRAWIDRARGRLADRIAQGLDGADHVGVVTALAIGQQNAISQTDWQRFARTGTNHLVAISGLHVGLVASFAALFGGGLWRTAARLGWPLPLWLPAQRIAGVCALIAGAGFVAMAGFGIPAQRAFWMLAAVFIATQSGRSPAPSSVWCWALFCVVLADPWAVGSAGFWLSFGAVGAILFSISARGRAVEVPSDAAEVEAATRDRQVLHADPASRRSASATSAKHRSASPGRVRPPSTLWQRRWRAVWPRMQVALLSATRIQLAVTIALIPATVSWFAQVPLLGPLANAVAIPWVSFLVVPPILAGAALPAPLDAFAFQFAHGAIGLLASMLDVLAAPQWALLRLPVPDGLTLLSAFVGLVWWLGPRGLPLQPLAPLLFLPLCLFRPPPVGEGEFRLTMLDIGQGNAALIETRRHRMIYDTGPPIGTSDAGERIVLPYLYKQGISRLDALVVSHNHDDHYGGAASLLNAIEVTRFVASLPPAQPLWRIATQRGADTERCRQGRSWQWDGIAFDVLWPQDPDAGLPPNGMSCVIRVSNGRHAVLLTGDIEAPQERALLAWQAAARGASASASASASTSTSASASLPVLQAQILMAPHHGSRTSSTPAFIDAVRPDHVVFQMGYLNRHRHPNKHVVPRYAAREVQMYRSDQDGAVRFETRGKTLAVEAYRRHHRRYWMGR